MNDYYSGKPLRIGSETQLLIDDTIIEDRWRLRRVMHPPVKHPQNPILARDKPWEGDMVHAPSVLWDDERGLYRMWYLTFNNSNYFARRGSVTYMCYAESEDGVHWTKPLFDHCPYGRYSRTNIVYWGTHDQGPYYGSTDPEIQQQRVRIADKGQIWKDPADPDPARRYKMISLEGRPRPEFNEVHCGVELVTSPDGIHWQLTGQHALLDHASDCLNHVVHDARRGRYLLYCRPPLYSSGRSGENRHHRRRVAVMTSPDFVHWSYPRTVLYPDEYDLPDYDHVRVFPCGNVFIMLYGAMEGDTTGRWELRLATSPDGIRWERFRTRETFLGRGAPGSWDAGGILPHGEPVPQGERLLLYYSGTRIGQEEQGDFTGAIGLATFKRDRFVEQRAGEETGYLLTKEFILEGKRLHVNLEHEKGPYRSPRLRVEILRHPPLGKHWLFEQAYEGFTLDHCDPLCLDCTDTVVTWRGNSDLSALAGKPVYLRFELHRMGLYSFRISPG